MNLHTLYNKKIAVTIATFSSGIFVSRNSLTRMGSTLWGYFCLWNIKKYGYLKAGTL